MKKDPVVFLDHILECIDLIEDYSEGVTESEFMGSLSIQDMIIRRIEIIGEAVKNLPDELKAQLGHTDLKTTSIYLKADINHQLKSYEGFEI